VVLPLTAVHPDPKPSAPRRHPASKPFAVNVDTCVQIAGLKVLIVDDEPDARALLRRLLEDCDATVFGAASADEAVAAVELKRPDVIVSDIGMPGEDGYSMIRRVRGLPADRGGNTPAVALTAYARSEDRITAILAGFQHHISKPVEPAELIAVVASAANRMPTS
jgi:CheY-like chemotaxis protein